MSVSLCGRLEAERGPAAGVLSLALAVLTLVLATIGPARGEEEAPRALPRFILTSHTGSAVSDEQLRGRIVLMFFGYTHCPDVCPTTMQTVAHAVELLTQRLGEKAARVQPVFVTVDPARDTQKALAEFVPYFHPRLMGLTGPLPMIERLTQALRVTFNAVGKSADNPQAYSVDHTAAVFLIGPDGGLVTRLPYETTAEQMADRVAAAMER